MAVAAPIAQTPSGPRVISSIWLVAIAVFIAVLVLAANRPVLGFDWLMFDDDINIFLNPYLGGLDGETLTWAFSNTDYVRRYLPLGWLGFGSLLEIDGYNAAIFHAAGWLLSGLNGALAFLLFFRLLRPAAAETFSSPAWHHYGAAAIAALIWSLHPLRAETAAWISGLLYLGSTSCACVALLLYFQAASTSTALTKLRHFLSTGFYLASLLIYPVFLALPAVLVWFRAFSKGGDRWQHARAEAKNLAGWWLAAGFTLAINVYAQVTASGPYPGFTSMEKLGLATRLLNAVQVYLHYIARTIWPETTSVFYRRTDQLLAIDYTKATLAIVLPLLLAALIWRKPRTAVIVCGGAGLLSLAPFIGAMDVEFLACDRYAVLWLGVVALAVGHGLMIRQNRLVTRLKYFAALLVLGCCWPAYQSALAPWEKFSTLQARIDRVMAAHPDPAMNFARPAMVFWWMGDRVEAEQRLRTGLSRFPLSSRLRTTEIDLADLEPRWRERVGSKTEISAVAIMHYDLGLSWIRRGVPAAGMRHFKRALLLAPQFTEAATALIDAIAKIETQAANSSRFRTEPGAPK